MHGAIASCCNWLITYLHQQSFEQVSLITWPVSVYMQCIVRIISYVIEDTYTCMYGKKKLFIFFILIIAPIDVGFLSYF